ncbi:MFS transporter [Streptomyces ossamyceticus]|uniref:MFS transporter n=1 Tax=Streptomyces ossamyceticus TaxID=249581 RepID=UPI0034431486
MGALRPRGTGVAQDADPVVVGERAEGVLGRSYRALSVGIVSVVLLIAFEAMAVGTAMPVAARELDGVSAYGFVFSAYFTTSLFGMVLSGQWSDLRGPLGPLTTGIAAFAAGLLLSGTAGAMWLFILGRAVQGLGGGLVIVALYVVVGRAYPERLRPSIMAGFAASWIIPSVVGPLAAGAVTEQLGWRWVFVGIPVLVVLPLGLALPQIRRRAAGPVGGPAPGPDSRADVSSVASPSVASSSASSPSSASASSPSPASPSKDGSPSGAHPAASRPSPASAPASSAPAPAPVPTLVPSSAPASPSPSPSFDRRRIRLALGISVGAGLLQYAAQDLRWLSVVPAAVGVALLVPTVLGLLPRGTYRAVRGLPSVVLLRGVAAGSFISAESFVPLMLVTQRGLSPTLAGFSLAAGGGAWALGSWVQARARVEPYRERLMTTGMVVVAAAIVTVPTVLIETVPVWTVAVAWAFGCFGMGLVISSTSVLLLKLSAPEEAGTNSAALQISDGLSNALLLAAGGAAFAALGGGAAGHTVTAASGSGSHPAAFVAVFLPMAAVALLGAWVTTRLRERT